MTKREIRSWLMDMDGVLVREEHAIAGADKFIARLVSVGLPFLVLTNNSIYTARDLAARLTTSGMRRGSGPRRWPPQGSSRVNAPAGRPT